MQNRAGWQGANGSIFLMKRAFSKTNRGQDSVCSCLGLRRQVLNSVSWRRDAQARPAARWAFRVATRHPSTLHPPAPLCSQNKYHKPLLSVYTLIPEALALLPYRSSKLAGEAPLWDMRKLSPWPCTACTRAPHLSCLLSKGQRGSLSSQTQGG